MKTARGIHPSVEGLKEKINVLENEILELRQELTEAKRRDNILRYRLKLNELSFEQSFNDVVTAVVDTAEELTGSLIAYFHFYDESTQSLALQSFSTRTSSVFCTADKLTEHYNLSCAGVWTDCIKQRRPVVHNDYAGLSHKKGLPEGHAQIIREMSVPVIREGVIVGILGVGNKSVDYTEDDVDTLSKFVDIAWEIICIKKLQIDNKKEEDKNSALLSTMIEAVALNELVYDEKGEISDYRILEVNDAYFSHTGIKSKEVQGKLASEIYGLTPGFTKQFWKKNILNEKPVVSDFYDRKKDKWMRISTSPLKDNRFTTVFSDITGLKKSEEKYRNNELKYRSIIETSKEGFCIIDLNGTIKEVNNTYLNLSGFSKEEIKGKKISDFEGVERPEETSEHIQMLTRIGFETFESIHKKKDGTLWPVEVTTRFLNLEGGIIYAYVRDITRKKEIEKEQEISIKLLTIINKYSNIQDLVSEANKIIKEFSGCEAVGIRYREDTDFPYLVSSGFSQKFLEGETYLHQRDKSGNLVQDKSGNPIFECMCGNILMSKFDPSLPFFTRGGSFWTNSTTELIRTSSEESFQGKTCTMCNCELYESVALIPLRIGDETFGLIQLNDRRKGMFDENKIHVYQKLAAYLSGAFSHFESRILLTKNEKRYRKISSLISNITYSCVDKSQGFHFDWLAGSVIKTFGYSVDEMKEKGCWKSLVVEEDIPVFNRNIVELRPGETSNCELRIKAKDGTIKWINTMAECEISAEDPEQRVIFGALIDISGTKKAEAALNHSHDLARYIIEHNRGAVAVHDRNMRYIYVSQRYLTDYNIKEKNIIGKHHYEVLPDLPQKWRIVHQEAMKGKILSSEDDIYEKADGSVVWTRWECRPWYEADNSIGGIIIYTEVITERKQIEIALKASEHQLNTIFNSAPVVMMLLNEKKQLIKINKFGCETTGRNVEQLSGLKLGDILGCVNAVMNPSGCGSGTSCKHCKLFNTIEDTFHNNNEFFKTEVVLTTVNDGIKKDHTILLSTSVVSTTPEKQVLLTIDDITERKEIEKELIRAKNRAEESDRLKSAFLANISHEVRTPMNGIMGFSDLLAKPNISEEKRNQFTTLIHDSCKQLLGIITDVIEISMIDSNQMSIERSSFNLNEFMSEMLLLFRSSANTKNINLFFRTSERKLKLYTDREKVKHIFSNLISNAIKFTDFGFIEFGYNLHDSEIEFFVRDSGIGIRNDLHEKIFERFRQVEVTDTRNYGGTGLGLSISKGLVALLNGRIWLHSEPGKGSTFYFTLPIDNVQKQKDEGDFEFMSRNKILVAEDDEINFFFIQEILENMKCSFLRAHNGSEAVQLFRKNDSIRLILMDIKMPLMDGFEAARQIRETDINIPIIAQTAYVIEDNSEEILESGFTGIIEKPIDKRKLESIVREYLQL